MRWDWEWDVIGYGWSHFHPTICRLTSLSLFCSSDLRPTTLPLALILSVRVPCSCSLRPDPDVPRLRPHATRPVSVPPSVSAFVVSVLCCS